MDTLQIPDVAPYAPALLALAVLCVAVPVQSVLAGVLGIVKGAEVPGGPLKGGHDSFAFRTLRTYGNSVENLPAFGLVVLLAIVAGVAPALVNWLAGIHVIIRLAYWVIYYAGIGAVAGGPRTAAYVLGLLANLVLAVATLLALL